MKYLKKIVIVLLTIININLLTGLIISCNFQKVLINGVLKETIKTEISKTAYKEPNIIINENAKTTKDLVKTDNDTINKILESDEVQSLIEDYLNKTINSLEEPSQVNEIDFEKDIIDYLKNNKEKIEKSSGIEITDEMIDKTSKTLQENDTNIYIKQKIRNTSNSMTTTEKTILKGYKTFISIKFRFLLTALFLLNIIIIFILKRPTHKVINTLGIIFATSGIETIITSLVIDFIIKKNTIFTKFNSFPLLKWGIICTVFGLIVIMVYNIVINKLKNKEME